MIFKFVVANLTQKENEENLRIPRMIGKFGIGLMDAAPVERKIQRCAGLIMLNSQDYTYYDFSNLEIASFNHFWISFFVSGWLSKSSIQSPNSVKYVVYHS